MISFYSAQMVATANTTKIQQNTQLKMN